MTAGVRAQDAPVDRTILPIPEPTHPPITELDVRKATPPPRFEVKAPDGASNAHVRNSLVARGDVQGVTSEIGLTTCYFLPVLLAKQTPRTLAAGCWRHSHRCARFASPLPIPSRAAAISHATRGGGGSSAARMTVFCCPQTEQIPVVRTKSAECSNALVTSCACCCRSRLSSFWMQASHMWAGLIERIKSAICSGTVRI
jgi:hypothetical protein